MAIFLPYKGHASHTAYSNYWVNNNLKLGAYVGSVLSPHVPLPPKPLFWNANFAVDSAYYLSYERLIYHTPKLFGLYLGADAAPLVYQSSTNLALSAYLSMHLYFFQTALFSPYFHYSVAGPTYLSKNTWGETRFSNHFVFQDTIGLGVTLLPKTPIDVGFSVAHYSNGGIFPINGGIQVPFVLWISTSFN